MQKNIKIHLYSVYAIKIDRIDRHSLKYRSDIKLRFINSNRGLVRLIY